MAVWIGVVDLACALSTGEYDHHGVRQDRHVPAEMRHYTMAKTEAVVQVPEDVAGSRSSTISTL